jgi:hypothetical protein
MVSAAALIIFNLAPLFGERQSNRSKPVDEKT